MIQSNISLNNSSKEPKEIISSLLKKLLGERLDKFEKKIKSDEMIINSIKEETNKMNKYLEDSMKRSKFFLYKN